MIEPPSLRSGSAFWTVKNSPFTFTSKVWSKWASVAAASGAMYGAGIGALIGREHWEEFDVGVGVAGNAGAGRIGIGLRYAF